MSSDSFNSPTHNLRKPAPVEHSDTVRLSQNESQLISEEPTEVWPEAIGLNDRFLLQDKIGQGGCGVVFRAYDRELGRSVAVKILKTQLLHDPVEIERFHRESRLTASLAHPGIPPVHDMGLLPDGRPFLAMKLIEGNTFSSLLKQEPTLQARWFSVFEQICHAVAFAHSRGVIHRDLKPSNVMVGTFGEVQVMDWGLAKYAGESEGAYSPTDIVPGTATLTQTGYIFGTPAYLAPEQAQGVKADFRSDVFGLGAILCEVLTGAPPYVAEDSRDALKRAVTADLAHAFARLNTAKNDPGLIQLCRDCIRPNPMERPASATNVAERVTELRIQAEQRVRQAELDIAMQRVQAESQRSTYYIRLAFLATLTGLLITLGVALLITERRSHEREQSRIREEQASNTARQRLSYRFEDIQMQYGFYRDRGLISQMIQQTEELATHARELADSDQEREIANFCEELRFIRDLETLRIYKAMSSSTSDEFWDQERISREYTQAFQKAGFDLVNRPVEARQRIEKSRIRQDIINALDDWGIHEQHPENRRVIWKLTAEITGAAWRQSMIPAILAQEMLAVLQTVPVEERTIPILTALGIILAEQKSETGTAMLSAACRRYPSDFWLLITLGNALYEIESKDETESAGCFRAALAIRPDCAYVWGRLGDTLFEKGDIFEAEKCYRRALNLEPESPIFLTNLGRLFRELGRYEEASKQLEKALQFNPKYVRAWYHQAMVYRDRNQHDRALHAANQAVQLEPNNPRPLSYLAWIYHDLGEYEKVTECFRKAAQLKPDDRNIWMNVGFSERELAHFDAAIEAFEKSLQLAPDSRSTIFALEQTRRLKTINQKVPDVESGRYVPEKPLEIGEFAGLVALPAQRNDRLAVTLYRKLEQIDPQRMQAVSIRAASCALGMVFQSDSAEQKQQYSQLAHKWLSLYVEPLLRETQSRDMHRRRSARDSLRLMPTEPVIRKLRMMSEQGKLHSESENKLWREFWAKLDQAILKSLEIGKQVHNFD